MKILNLYAGIGGNRKLWNEVKDDIEVTAVEFNPEIAKIYQDFFPNDKMIVGDAHEYLLNHFKEYDFIWSSPPCPTHSRMTFFMQNAKGFKHKYPDMNLYQEIILLKTFSKSKYCIENVISYYEPLIKPQKMGRHYYWSNYHITQTDYQKQNIYKNTPDCIKQHTYENYEKMTGLVIKDWHNYKGDKKKLQRNCVDSEIGKHIFNCAINNLELF